MTRGEALVGSVALRLRKREPVSLAELEEAAIAARRAKLGKAAAALEEEIAWRRTTGTTVVGSIVLSKKEQDRLYKNLAVVRETIAKAAAKAGRDVRKAAGKVGGGLALIAVAIVGAAVIRRRKA